ncbi:MAG: circadian clock protein KaiC [FCB group bacterium]|jgi:circadian clock protein KaiC|nr:circadian clock protein KaiC [FCB group bacterium]
MSTIDQPAGKLQALEKCPTGIKGLDDITGGGLPRGRTSLVCGSAGCGKTTLAMEFLVRGAVEFDEPGVFVSFEENSQELAQNFASMGFDLPGLVNEGKLVFDYVHADRSEIDETGEYDLEALFIRLNYAIDSIGAKRVVLDTIEALFGALINEGILRAELRRLFRWLKDKGVTAIVTGEQGENTLTRHGLEEYVADCVIFLDHRIVEQLSTRRLRIVKYRGSSHGPNEYPFLIGDRGITIMPLASLRLDHRVSLEHISSGVARLDEMLGGKGYFRGSTVLISGTAGTGKSSLLATFADAACRRGEKCLYFAFEESPNQIVRNMRSIGIDLEPWVRKGLLRFHAERATAHGLETHLVQIHALIDEFQPESVVFDPITNLLTQGTGAEVKAMASRLIDFLKNRGVTAAFTSLTSGGNHHIEQSEVEISSLIDTWVYLHDVEMQGERNRTLYILKSRGMGNSNQVREFLLTDQGIQLLDVYLGPAGVLTGSARATQEASERLDAQLTLRRKERKRKDLERRQQALEAQILALRADWEAHLDEAELQIAEDELREQALREGRQDMAQLRRAESEPSTADAGARANES